MPSEQQPTLVRRAAPLRQQVVDLISAGIATGTYEAGERLVERDLCDRYQVSRAVIREALRHVEALGLVETVPNHGPVVASLTLEEAAWLYEVKGSLEALAGQLFEERATRMDRLRLVSVINDMENHAARRDMANTLISKERFYDTLMAGAHNPIVESLLRTVYTRTRLLRPLSVACPDRAASIVEDLRAILDAILAGDGEAAARACRNHARNTAAVLLGRLVDGGEG